jgi:tellurite methyltransferase
MEYDELQERYGREDFYWGTEPNDFARRTADHAPENGTVVDIGAGEGRDAVYFAERGFDVVAVDIASNGLEKAERLADERGVEIRTRVGDINTFELHEPVDVVYSIGTIQYLHPNGRRERFEQLRRRTNRGGIHALFAFVSHPDVPLAPDWSENEHRYEQGELDSYYSDWVRLGGETVVFEDDSGGEPHRHAAEQALYRKP